MTEIFAHPPLSAIDNQDAALYIGHLTVAAEAALPRATRETQIALTWLCAHIATQGARTWTADLDDIAIGEFAIGSWRATARTFPGRPDRIGFERRATLIRDGNEILALAHPFLEGQSMDDATTNLVDFSVMQLCAAHAPQGVDLALRDLPGTEIRISLRRNREFLRKFFPQKSIA